MSTLSENKPAFLIARGTPIRAHTALASWSAAAPLAVAAAVEGRKFRGFFDKTLAVGRCVGTAGR